MFCILCLHVFNAPTCYLCSLIIICCIIWLRCSHFLFLLWTVYVIITIYFRPITVEFIVGHWIIWKLFIRFGIYLIYFENIFPFCFFIFCCICSCLILYLVCFYLSCTLALCYTRSKCLHHNKKINCTWTVVLAYMYACVIF